MRRTIAFTMPMMSRTGAGINRGKKQSFKRADHRLEKSCQAFKNFPDENLKGLFKSLITDIYILLCRS
jgi:hypothetical protein